MERQSGSEAAGSALSRLDALTRRLRVECPWDREQNERSIVPHTVDEAYELADAVRAGDDAQIVDELGDVLFQVHFLALLLEERGVGDLAAVADHVIEKLIRRHPHVFGDVVAEDAQTVRANWDAIKRDEPGRDASLFGSLPAGAPALSRARRIQRRAAETGFDHGDARGALSSLREELDELERALDSERASDELGDVLFAAVAVARKLEADPELELREAAARFQRRIESAVALAGRSDENWSELAPARQLELYEQARSTEEQ